MGAAQLSEPIAAKALDVPEPFLAQLLDDEKIPHQKMGHHRYVKVSDVLAFKRTDDAARAAAADELNAEAQRLALHPGY